MRRSIDSEYIRKKRTSRRPLDNRRRVKRKNITMVTDKSLYLTVAILTSIWLGITGWSVWNAFQ